MESTWRCLPYKEALREEQVGLYVKEETETNLTLKRQRSEDNGGAELCTSHTNGGHAAGSENCLEQKLKIPRRRCQQPKVLNSPEDNMYYNQLNGTLEYQGSKRKPRKLGQIKVLDWEDEYYKSLSAVDSITEEDNSVQALPSSRGVSF
ncbi:Myosin-IIIb [Varanus komodoensis]|nr:Myosin-IIIb [Varanus komodoensis]